MRDIILPRLKLRKSNMAEKLLDAQDVSVEFKIAGEYQKALH